MKPETNDRSVILRIVDPLQESDWDRLISSHSGAGCFHTSAWAKVLHDTYNHKPFYLQFFCGRQLVAMLPLMELRSPFTGRRGVCVPFSDACEPLVFDPEVIGIVTEQLVRFARERRWRYLEIRGGEFLRVAANPAVRFYGHALDLRRSAQELITSFASPVRRAIRKAERSGVRALVLNNLEAVNEFYQLHIRTRRRHGIPPQPASFFFNIYEHVIRQGFGFVVLAWHGPHVVAAAIFFRFGKNALFKYGASDKKYQEFRANNLVMWHGIQFSARSGAETLHFGRTNYENEGLRRFKLSWNTEEETLDYFRVDPAGRTCRAHIGSNSAFHKQIFGKLPLVVNRLAGSMIYPHLD